MSNQRTAVRKWAFHASVGQGTAFLVNAEYLGTGRRHHHRPGLCKQGTPSVTLKLFFLVGKPFFSKLNFIQDPMYKMTKRFFSD